MSLLRAGLWEQDLELPCTPDVDAWELVLSLGRVQAVMGLVVRGIAHLPEEQRDLEELEPVLQAIKEALSRANHTYARVQVTLFQILAESRLHPIIQKGSEAAKYYADPSVRQVGDIDLYLPPEEFKRKYPGLWTLCPVQIYWGPYSNPLSMRFSRQEYWSRLPFPSPGDLSNPGIKPGSPALQADALTSEPPYHKPNKQISAARLCD